jgi:hypothetical protein
MSLHRREPGRLLATFTTLAVLVGVLGGCGVETLGFATPPATPASSTTTALPRPDLTGVELGKVSGRTTTTMATIGPGGAALSGRVLGPQGPVAGATVEAVRFAGSSEASRQVATAADGTWTIPAVLGGRYRLRAWQAPALAMATPQIFFLGGTQAMAIDLQVQAFTGENLLSAANPVATLVGDSINVVVAVRNQAVDADGIVSYRPAPGVPVALASTGNLGINANPVSTDSSGNAGFTLTCLSAGTSTVTGTSPGGGATTLPTLTCETASVPLPTPTTVPPSTTAPATTTTVPRSTTSTTRRGP